MRDCMIKILRGEEVKGVSLKTKPKECIAKFEAAKKERQGMRGMRGMRGMGMGMGMYGNDGKNKKNKLIETDE